MKRHITFLLIHHTLCHHTSFPTQNMLLPIWVGGTGLIVYKCAFCMDTSWNRVIQNYCVYNFINVLPHTQLWLPSSSSSRVTRPVESIRFTFGLILLSSTVNSSASSTAESCRSSIHPHLLWLCSLGTNTSWSSVLLKSTSPAKRYGNSDCPLHTHTHTHKGIAKQ